MQYKLFLVLFINNNSSGSNNKRMLNYKNKKTKNRKTQKKYEISLIKVKQIEASPQNACSICYNLYIHI